MTSASREITSKFAPVIEVLTPEPDEPMRPDLSFDALAARFPAIHEAEAVCWTGSTAAGWGNALSDVDLYVFSDKQLELQEDETSETWSSTDQSGLRWFSWMGRYGDVCVDLKVWPTDALPTLLAPFLAPTEPEFCGFAYYPQDFIYRLAIAVPLQNEPFFEHMRSLIAKSSYARSLARSRKSFAENQLNDVVGQLSANDVISARMSASLAAYTAADHCLLLAGDLCRAEKWLLRRLQATPECGIGVDEYQTEILDGARSGESVRDCAIRMARWAQSNLIRVEPQALVLK